MAKTLAAELLDGSSDPLVNAESPSTPARPDGPSATKTKDKRKPTASTPTSLTISRNKHWRYISAFHGPWLQLPHEILETLAHSNYFSPRPRQTDPAVLYDLLKVRKLVDEAADLAVRAQNGTASSALGADNGLPGSALGLNSRGAGGNAKLSPERKYRMREMATQKLSQAYRLDEVAASVATMQSASALDTVASLVLQRAPNNTDARYVHFFHEKIPSRMMAEYTPLAPLDDIVAQELGHAAPYRTRALTKVFKEDFAGAARDLTEALNICRMEHARHTADKNQLVSMKTARDEAEKRKTWSRDWISDNRVAEDDQPKGLEMQLLFQRGNQYLSLACQHIRVALEAFGKTQRQRDQNQTRASEPANGVIEPKVTSSAEMEAFRRGIDAREAARKYAKRALRDYTAFLANLDYAFAATQDPQKTVFDRDALLESTNAKHDSISNGVNNLSQALVRRPSRTDDVTSERGHPSSDPLLKVYSIDKLLSSSPPQDLPLYPPVHSNALATRSQAFSANNDSQLSHHEMITYHPLMPETLHSLLLIHCILQTPQTTVARLAYNAARLARLADGYPFFLSARSPARADWAEILRKTGNWVGLTASWDRLCKADATSSPSETNGSDTSLMRKSDRRSQQSTSAAETDEQRKERIHKEAVLEALGDERVVDDETFQRAVAAREKRAHGDIHGNGVQNGSDKASEGVFSSNGNGIPKSTGEPFGRRNGSAVAKDEEYLIGTERAETIAKWILEAPPVGEGTGTGKPKKRRKPAKRPVNGVQELNNGVNGLSLNGTGEGST